MAFDERWAEARAGMPAFAERWFGDTLTYPTGRGQQHVTTGWECPRCRRCWAPHVPACQVCPQEQAPPAFIAKAGADCLPGCCGEEG